MRRLRLLLVTFLSLFALLTPTPVGAAPQDQTVYVTRTGKKYHVAGCRYLRSSQIAMNLKDAVNAGYTPCSVCRPPTLSEPGTSEAPQAGNPDARVWVNTHSGVYHCPGTRWYGSTKHGEYMTQKQAREKGNRPAYGKPCQ